MKYIRGIILLFVGFGIIIGSLIPEIRGYMSGMGAGLLLIMASEELSKDYVEGESNG